MAYSSASWFPVPGDGPRYERPPEGGDDKAPSKGARRTCAPERDRRGERHGRGTSRPRTGRQGGRGATRDRATTGGDPSCSGAGRPGKARERCGNGEQTSSRAGRNDGSATRTRRVRGTRKKARTAGERAGGGGGAVLARGVLGHAHAGATGGNPHEPDTTPLRATPGNGAAGVDARHG